MSQLTIKVVDNLNGEMFGDQAITGEVSGFDAGFNFRATSGYVTDSANQTYVLAADTYPTNRGGYTFGWVNGTHTPVDADRNNGIDVRLAGINGCEDYFAATATYFRVDLPSAGTYNISLAIGDASFAVASQYVDIQDTTTSKFVVNAGSVSSGTFTDANTNNYTSANWPASNTPQSAVFSTTQFRMVIGQGTTTDQINLAHLRIVSA